jgi:hypothetical protein
MGKNELIVVFGAVFFGAAFVWGLVTGRSFMRWPLSAERATNPVGYWLGQATNAALAILLTYAALTFRH